MHAQRSWLTSHRVSHSESEVRPTGFEPVTLGSEDCCASGATINVPNQLRQTPDDVVPTVVPSAAEPAPSQQFPADLARLGAEWDLAFLTRSNPRFLRSLKLGELAMHDADLGPSLRDARQNAGRSQCVEWYHEGQSRIVDVNGVRIEVRFIGRKGRRARIAIVTPPGAVFQALERAR